MKRIRFSLRSLILLVFTIGGAMGVWWRWEPWATQWTSAVPGGTFRFTSFSEDGSIALSSKHDSAAVWETHGGKKLIEFSDCMSLRSGAQTNVYLYRSTNHAELWNPFSKERLAIWDYRDVRNMLLFPGRDDSLIRFDQEAHELSIVGIDGKITGSLSGVTHFLVSNDKMQIATIDANHCVHIWDSSRLQEIRYVQFQNSAKGLVGKSRKFERFLTSGEGNDVEIWDGISGAKLQTIKFGSSSPWDLEISPDLTLVSGTGHPALMLDASTGCQLWSPANPRDFGYKIHEMSFCPDGSAVVITEYSNDYHTPIATNIVDARSGKLINRIDGSGRSVCRAYYSPTEHCIFASEVEGHVVMWRRRRPEQWWGIAWLPDFWIASICGICLLFSLLCDWRERARKI